MNTARRDGLCTAPLPRPGRCQVLQDRGGFHVRNSNGQHSFVTSPHRDEPREWLETMADALGVTIEWHP